MTETNATNGDRFKFAGMEYDSTTGQYYDQARDYDSATGRFMSQDPKGFSAGDMDLYRYVDNLPTSSTDPSGMEDPWKELTGQVTFGWDLPLTRKDHKLLVCPNIDFTVNYGPSVGGAQLGLKYTFWPVSDNPFTPVPILTIPKPPNPGSAPPSPFTDSSTDLELQMIMDVIKEAFRSNPL